MSSEPWFLEKGIPRFLDWNLLWREALGRFGKSPCLRLSNRWVSFQELGEDVEHQALLLQANTSWRLGALVLLPVKGENFFAKLLAVWCAGGVAVPLRDDAYEGNVRPEGSVDFVWGEGEPVASGSRIGLPSSEWHAIYHTSGSTGEPRAIVRGWRQAIYEAGHYAAVLGLREGMNKWNRLMQLCWGLRLGSGLGLRLVYNIRNRFEVRVELRLRLSLGCS
jgi:glycine/D-amino acid oxidase-like deaminating enzyme